MTPTILVAGIGNIFLSDDGFGPEVVRRFAATRPEVPGVRVVDYGIRGMHLAYDLLDGYDALAIVDAVPGNPSRSQGRPGSISVLEVGPADLGEGEFDAHGMNPVAVLANLGALGGELPRTYVVGCCPDNVEEGIGLSDIVSGVIDDAVVLLGRLVEDLSASPRLRAG